MVVNSAGASFKGYFEEMSQAQVEQQIEQLQEDIESHRSLSESLTIDE